MRKGGAMSTQAKENNDTTVLSRRRKVKGPGLLMHKGVLVVLSNNFFGRSYVIKTSRVLIGRAGSCDITIKDPLISKKHCVVSTEDGQRFFIEDLGSTNATYLNKKTVKRKTQISYGDRLIIGNTVLRFFLEEKVHEKE
jgi:pSer/pThr/pTyr-binding forkhead associated (FHA) protein